MAGHEIFIKRCFDLARLGAGRVSPNPMVGAVLVYEGKIIGEGFHEKYGHAHAEVNALAAVKESDKALIPYSTLYVSLEPCCVHGNTPPCTDLIIRHKIPKVVISSLDSSSGVNGKGVEILRAAGVEVVLGVLKPLGEELARFRNTFATQNRPYIILKMAQTENGYMAALDLKPFRITNPESQRLVHRWRSEADAIVVGTNTAFFDDPQLTNRLYFGSSPLRIVFDRKGILPLSLALFNGTQPTLVFTQAPYQASLPPNLEIIKVADWDLIAQQLLQELYQRKCSTVLIEGGPTLLHYFIENGYWDEAIVIVGQGFLPQGLLGPRLPVPPDVVFNLLENRIYRYFNPNSLHNR